jgi:aerobic-type carbon monoxide dehydrogenase small subunit (CoxS/CutS family)
MITLIVNGIERTYNGPLSTTLLNYLREELGITTVRPGCLMGNCKGCIVYVDGARALACQFSLSEMNAKTVETAHEW